ncbi:MAG TPA: RdgB/HAM1 family non-canonical purine NTP pyrophosphatase [Tepidisphaeraceae bacterium]|nr:RdgB/HAM1 family non-canonical purine NTP pyrophosphatase [Tepidisphaeraceae bacterium]
MLIATGNAGKVKEFRAMLGSDRFVWHDLSEFPAHVPVPETGETFHDNACLKAAGYAKQAATWALADDSGLEVDALGGKPGVHSARWAQLSGTGSGDADNNATLLKQLEGVPDDRRTARFVCVLALSDPAGNIVLTARDTVEGRILHAPRGNNGFGYDPLFLIDSLGNTTAELPPEKKHEISHRGKALRRLRVMMEAGKEGPGLPIRF